MKGASQINTGSVTCPHSRKLIRSSFVPKKRIQPSAAAPNPATPTPSATVATQNASTPDNSTPSSPIQRAMGKGQGVKGASQHPARTKTIPARSTSTHPSPNTSTSSRPLSKTWPKPPPTAKAPPYPSSSRPSASTPPSPPSPTPCKTPPPPPTTTPPTRKATANAETAATGGKTIASPRRDSVSDALENSVVPPVRPPHPRVPIKPTGVVSMIWVGGSMDSQFPVHHPRHVGVRTPAKSLHQATQVLDGSVNVEYL